ncbi:MAG: hypothetical protein GH151_04730 [Bacteroidetes bacterium]|nr:hypothetical protein [Bacteroidota bacterium]
MNGYKHILQKISDKKYILLTIILILSNVSLFSQGKKTRKPEIHIDVTTETDENGNIIRYDSTYSWSYSTLDTIWDGYPYFRDSLFQFFKQRFDTGFFDFPFSHRFPDFDFEYSFCLDSSFWKDFGERFSQHEPLFDFDFENEPFFPFDTLFRNNRNNRFFRHEPFFNFDEFFKNYRKMIEQYFEFSPLYPDSLPPPKKQKPVPKKIFHGTRIKV